MTSERPYLPRPGISEKEIVEEMIRNRDSEHWQQCHEFVKHQVSIRAKNFTWISQEKISLEATYKIFRDLPKFRFESTLRTWVHTIIGSCIVDEHRYLQRQERLHVSLEDTFTKGDHEGEEPRVIGIKPMSVEDTIETREEMRNGADALLKYVDTHRNPVRNRQIIKMVIFEGRTLAETAKAVGCHPGVVHYVIEEAQRYAREKMDHQP